jgi:hypothetical protein
MGVSARILVVGLGLGCLPSLAVAALDPGSFAGVYETVDCSTQSGPIKAESLTSKVEYLAADAKLVIHDHPLAAEDGSSSADRTIELNTSPEHQRTGSRFLGWKESWFEVTDNAVTNEYKQDSGLGLKILGCLTLWGCAPVLVDGQAHFKLSIARVDGGEIDLRSERLKQKSGKIISFVECRMKKVAE